MRKPIPDKASKCTTCPVRRLALFRQLAADELDEVAKLRSSVRHVPRGADVFGRDEPPELYTVFSGWAFSSKMLPNGRRQIVDYHLPGDFLGLQHLAVADPLITVEALTPVSLCVFPRGRMIERLNSHPSLAMSLNWMLAREEAGIAERLLSVGRRSALDRLIGLILELHTRISWREGGDDGSFSFPPTQRHLADSLGLTPEHVNRALRDLKQTGLLEIRARRLTIHAPERLKAMIDWKDTYLVPRPVF